MDKENTKKVAQKKEDKFFEKTFKDKKTKMFL